MQNNAGFKIAQTSHESDNNNTTAQNIRQGATDDRLDDTTVYVRNLPYKVPWQRLKSFFNKFGHVIYVRIINDYVTKKPKGYGFVRFSNPEGARRAATAPPQMLHFLGRTMRVQLTGQTIKKKPFYLEANLLNEQLYEEDHVVDSASPISWLNDDPLILVFRYLTATERIAVERAFSDHFLYKIIYRCSSCLVSLDLSLVSSQLSNRSLEVIGQNCKNIEQLNMSRVRANNRGVEELTKMCTNIRWLNVVGCRNISENGFWHIFRNCKKIEYLDCSRNTSFTGKCLVHATSNFKSLHANSCQELTNEGIINIIERCPQMETLKLNSCNLLTYQTISTLMKALSHLKETSIGDLPGQSGRQHIVQHFVTPGIIVKLELFNCALNDSNLLLICNSCPLISELDISINRLTDVSVTQISALKHLEYLSACDLFYITDASLMDVARHGKLRKLRVQGCKKLTDKLMYVFAEKCMQLGEVDIAGIPNITTNTVRAFHHSTLQRDEDSRLMLYAAYNDFDDDIVHILAGSPSLCVIEDYHPWHPFKLQGAEETEEEKLWLLNQNLEMEKDRVLTGMFPYLGLDGWRICQGDFLVDSDEDSDGIYDLIDEYFENDDPLAEEYWNLS